MSESNPVKEIFYNYLEKLGESKIQKLLSQKKSSKLVEKILLVCHSKINALESNNDENISTFCTAMLHYLLTNSLITSQIKIIFNKIE